MKNLFPTLFLFSSLCGLAFASGWKQEVNGRWSFSLAYPASLIPEPALTKGGGRRYHSANQEVSLVAERSHTNTNSENAGENLNGFWQKEVAERGDTVTYKVKKDDFYVVSGVTHTGYKFYHKVFFYPTYWVEFEITYPIPNILSTMFGWKTSHGNSFPHYLATANTTARKP